MDPKDTKFKRFQKPTFPDLTRAGPKSKSEKDKDDCSKRKDQEQVEADEEDEEDEKGEASTVEDVKSLHEAKQEDGGGISEHLDENQARPTGFFQHFCQSIFSPRLVSYAPVVLATIFASRLVSSPLLLIVIWFLCDGLEVASAIKACIFRSIGLTGTFSRFPCPDPAFVFDGDVETMGWMNTLLRHFWTKSLRPWLNQEGKDFLNRQLSSSHVKWPLPRWLISPEVTRLDIGRTAPWITGVKAQETSDGEGLLVDVGLYIHLQPRINVSLNSILSFGIDELVISGSLRLAFNPIIKDGNGLTSMHLSFLRVPLLDYHTTGLASFLGWTIPKSLLTTFCYQLLGLGIHPRYFTLNLHGVTTTDFEKVDQLITEPVGVVRMKFAKKFGRVDTSLAPFVTAWLTKERPHCIISLAEEEAETALRQCATFDFPVTKRDMEGDAQISVEAIDADGSPCVDGSGRLVKRKQISVAEVMRTQKGKLYYHLGRNNGKLLFKFKFIKVSLKKDKSTCNVSSNPTVSQAVLALAFHQMRANVAVYHPFLSVGMSGGPNSLSSEGKANQNYEFNDAFLFSMHDVVTDKVEFLLLDSKSLQVSAVREVTKLQRLTCDFIDGETPKILEGLDQQNYFVLGRAALNVEEFTGFRQLVRLESSRPEEYLLIVTGVMYFCCK